MNYKIYTPFLFFLILCFSAYGQTRGQYLKAAEKSFLQENYYAALQYYQIVLEFDSTKTDIWYKIGESAKAFHAYSIAEESYKEVLESEEKALFPLKCL